MDSRKELILNTIIKEHIKTGSPVGSSVLVDKYKLGFSPATVRNEMANLEEEDYIIQPYTSAGRVPTEKAYQHYLKTIKVKSLNEKDKKSLADCFGSKNEQDLKQVAKELSRLSGNAVFWAFHKYNLYYTGISNLFQQPEFRQANLVCDISAVIDSLDEILDKVFDQIGSEPEVLIGVKNPFGHFCGTILVKYKYKDNIGLFGILGPIRMDYEKNFSLINFIHGNIK